MNFGQLFGNNRNLFGNCRAVSEIFRKRWSRSNLQIISGNLIKKSSRKALSNLGTNLISASSMAGVFLRFLYALHFIIILILFYFYFSCCLEMRLLRGVFLPARLFIDVIFFPRVVTWSKTTGQCAQTVLFQRYTRNLWGIFSFTVRL